jgi:hypothetical protein
VFVSNTLEPDMPPVVVQLYSTPSTTDANSAAGLQQTSNCPPSPAHPRPNYILILILVGVGLVLVAIAIVIGCCLWKRRQKARSERQQDPLLPAAVGQTQYYG